MLWMKTNVQGIYKSGISKKKYIKKIVEVLTQAVSEVEDRIESISPAYSLSICCINK